MQVFELRNDGDELVAFQIPWLGKSKTRRVLRRISKHLELDVLRKPLQADRLCNFTVRGVMFEAMEMWDGSGRCWIGPVQFGPSHELDELCAAFARTRRGLFS